MPKPIISVSSGTLKPPNTEDRTKFQILNGAAFNEPYNALAPLPALGSWKLSSKKSAVLPTTTAAYLALEAAAAKYAPKAASDAAAAAQKEWWDAIGKYHATVKADLLFIKK